MSFLFVALGGALGAVARYAISLIPLLVFILGFAIGMIVTALSPAMKTGE